MSRARIDQESITGAESLVKRLLEELRAQGKDSIDQLWMTLETSPVEDSDSALRIYFLIVHLLERDNQERKLKQQQKAKLKDIAEKCLRYVQILPVTSQHSYLYARLYQLLAWDKLELGQFWESVALRLAGDYLSRDGRSSGENSEILAAYQAWSLGHLRLAKVTCHALLVEPDTAITLRQDALRLLVRIHRLSDERSAAHDLLRLLQADKPVSEADRLSLELEELLCEFRSSQGLAALQDFVKQSAKKLAVFEWYLAHLWLFASRVKIVPQPLRRVSPLPQTHYGIYLSRPREKIIELFECLQYMNETDVALNLRFERLGKTLSALGSDLDPELSLVFVAAALRWLNRSKQLTFAAILLDEYRTMSLRASEGRTPDALGMMGDIQESLPVVTHKTVSRTEVKLYTGFAPRLLKLSLLIAKALARISVLPVRHLLSPEQRRQHRTEVMASIFLDIEHCLAEMKGPLMKLCQTLAAFHLLDERSQHILREVFRSAPPVPFASLKPVLEEDLGREVLEQIFPYFHIEPLAVASLGEVFRARTREGVDVAVKIKYPEIEQIIRSDLKLARLLRPLYTHFFFEGDIDGILHELDERFARETDYQQEARAHKKFYELFDGDPQVRIPKVFEAYSTSRILVTELIDAPRVDVYLETASIEQRAQLARRMLWFSMRTGLEFGFLQIDPHLGNMLADDEYFYMLDFGASYQMSPGLVEGFRAMILAKYHGDLRLYYDTFLKLGYMKPELVSFEMFRDGPGPHLLAPFAVDKVRPYFLPGQKTFVDYVNDHHWDRYFNPPTTEFFALIVSQYMEDILHSFRVELNWHQELGHILRALGLLGNEH